MATQPILGGEMYVDGQNDGAQTINDHQNRSAHGPNLIVLDKTLATPPGSPSDGDAYVVASGGTGDWLGHDDEVAMYYSGWIFRAMPVGEVFSDLSLGTNGKVQVKSTTAPAYVDVVSF
uniref:Uncharacterized protein n=1 Tax=viral metagenome TaxID=1070528 RepID=A0A6M3J8R6_9ZZZZ